MDEEAWGRLMMDAESDFASPSLAFVTVAGAARLDRLRADAVLAVDLMEDERRRRMGVGAVSRLHLLDTLMKLPVGKAVPAADLLERDLLRVVASPVGVVECSEQGLMRRLRPAVEVVMVRVAAGDWSARLRQAASFARFAPALVMLNRPPTDEQILQADYFGVGIADADEQYVRPTTPKPSFQAVDWLFSERAYETWLIGCGDSAVSEAAPRHQAPPADAARGRTR